MIVSIVDIISSMNISRMSTLAIEEPEEYKPKTGFCGFRNIGNTCYMNSILQLLFHCKPFVAFIIRRTHDELSSEPEYARFHKIACAGLLRAIEQKKI